MTDDTTLPIPTPAQSAASPGKSNPATLQYVVVGVGVVLIAIIAWSFLSSNPVLPPINESAELSDGTVPETLDNPEANLQALKTTLSKEKFLQKLYETNRDEYNLYEKAAVKMGVSVQDIQQFFFDCCDLQNESDIFSELPPIPQDFPKVAYDVSSGKLYQIGLLGQEYYKQPEFYTFVDQETGVVNREYAFRPWKDPQLDQWGDNGMQAYPADQYTSVSLSKDGTFRAAVFVTNAWNIQNYVGINLVTNDEANDQFDITIIEDQTGKSYFKLDPTFPRFGENWATKVIIEGKVKPTTAPGEYTITINPVSPPTELSAKWADEHTGLYAPYGFIKPSDGYINLHIIVEE